MEPKMHFKARKVLKACLQLLWVRQNKVRLQEKGQGQITKNQPLKVLS
jgi:hypothetical protein